MNIYSKTARWLALLPLANQDQAAEFSGVTPGETGRAIEALSAAGWLYKHEIAEHDDGPLFALSPAAMRRLRREPATAGLDLGEVPHGQLRRRAAAGAIVAEPVTVTINAAMAAIATALRLDDAGVLTEAVYRPTSPKARSLSADPRPLLRLGHIEGRARRGQMEARFALFVDRSALPTSRRRKLLQDWQELSVAGDGAERQTPLLVLCSDDYERDRWVEWSRKTSGSLPSIAFALQDEVCAGCRLDDRVWQPARGYEPLTLRKLLRWRDAPDDLDPSAPVNEQDTPPWIAEPGQVVPDLMSVNRSHGPTEHAARRILSLEPEERRIALLVGMQPWLSAMDIARAMGSGESDVARRVETLREGGVVVSAEGSDGAQRWTSSDLWIRVCASRAGDGRSWESYAKATGLLRTHGGEQASTPKPHAAGVARCLGLIVAAARGAGLTVEDWRTEQWWRSDVGRRQPLPDAACRLRRPNGEPVVCLIEFEHLESNRQGPTKVRQWTKWFRDESWRELRGPVGSPAEPPNVFVIYSARSPRRRSLTGAVESGSSDIPLYAVTEDDFAAHGFGQPVWLRAGGELCSPFPGESA